MCIIIDTNRISDILSKSEDAMPVLEWILKPGSHVAIGGTKLLDEYKRVPKFFALIGEFERAGKVRRFNSSSVDGEQRKIELSGLMTSDDPHIIGLAIVSDCRLLYSDDTKLHDDFKNTAIMRPKGKVYQCKDHKRLLAGARRCSRA